MNNENKPLHEEFPVQFAQYGKPVTESCMGFGCECGSGWMPIIRALCLTLGNIEHNHGVQAEFAQVKEKFGELRIYIDLSVSPEWEVMTGTRLWKARFRELVRCLRGRPLIKKKSWWFNKRRNLAARVRIPWDSLVKYSRDGYPRVSSFSKGQAAAYAAVSMAGIMSTLTCESCGTTQGVSQDRKGWISTLCPECRKES